MWETALGSGDNQTDFLIDYRNFAPVKVRRLRLEIFEAPKGMRLGVLEFTAFGMAPSEKTNP